MFFKYSTSLLICHSFLFAGILGLEDRGVTIENLPHEGKNYLLKRNIPDICKNVFITSEILWDDNYANKEVPSICKSTFVTTKGHLLPMELYPEVETYGELEVLEFIQRVQESQDFLLVDSRRDMWYSHRTIPGSINIPFTYFDKKRKEITHANEALKRFGVFKNKEGNYDFSKAKTLVLFCNASWCNQSARMAYALLELDYPAEKIKWYRGGMQNWLSVGMSSIAGVSPSH